MLVHQKLASMAKIIEETITIMMKLQQQLKQQMEGLSMFQWKPIAKNLCMNLNNKWNHLNQLKGLNTVCERFAMIMNMMNNLMNLKTLNNRRRKEKRRKLQ